MPMDTLPFDSLDLSIPTQFNQVYSMTLCEEGGFFTW